nr:hypothetical protein [Tanacetum cinerariifolium]
RTLFNRFAKADSIKVVPPPISGDYTSLSDHSELDESQMSYGTKSSTSSDSKFVPNDFISCDDSDKSSEVNTSDFASSDSSGKSLEPTPEDSTLYASPSSFLLQHVLLRTSKVNIPPARPQPVPTGKPNMFAPIPAGRKHRPFLVPTYRGYSPSENPFSYDKDEGIFNSGCSRSMTGLQVQQRPDGILINQDKYVQGILNKFDLGSIRTATTPYEAPNPKSKNEFDSPINVHLYRSMIGSLMYLTALRSDIMFAVSACLRYQVTPTTSNLEAVKNIFKYVKGQPKLGLWYLK